MAGAAQAQSLSEATGPAELPPSAFSGAQFVDSSGCAYIRAGYAGNVQWIPRVNRDRTQLCGFRPTFAQGSVPVTSVSSEPRVVAAAAPTPAPKRRSISTTPRKALAYRPATTPDPVTRVETVDFAEVSPSQLIGPSGINRRIRQAKLPIPPGYKRAWTDGRLNPLRGAGTQNGQAQMAQIWSDTVPRRLIEE